MYVGGDMMKLGMLLIRWMLATSFLVHGTLKFVDLDGTIHFLGSFRFTTYHCSIDVNW